MNERQIFSKILRLDKYIYNQFMSLFQGVGGSKNGNQMSRFSMSLFRGEW